MLTTLTARETYIGNGVTTVFAYPFKIWASGDLEIYLTDAAGAVTQVTSNYTLSGVGNDSGGNVTYPVLGDPISSDYQLTVIRALTIDQSFFDAVNNQAFQAETLESAIDKVVAQIQQMKDDVDRSLKGDLTSAVLPDLPAAEAGKVLAWNSTEDAVENLAVSGAVIAAGSVGTTELGDMGVTTAKLADGAVTAVKIADANVTTVKIADANVTEAKLATPAKGVLVSSNDTTMGYLNGKLVAGAGVTLTEGSDGANETLSIAAMKLPAGTPAGTTATETKTLIYDEDIQVGDTLSQGLIEDMGQSINWVIDAIDNTSTGHDHDGTDSKFIPQALMSLSGTFAGWNETSGSESTKVYIPAGCGHVQIVVTFAAGINGGSGSVTVDGSAQSVGGGVNTLTYTIASGSQGGFVTVTFTGSGSGTDHAAYFSILGMYGYA